MVKNNSLFLWAQGLSDLPNNCVSYKIRLLHDTTLLHTDVFTHHEVKPSVSLQSSRLGSDVVLMLQSSYN